MMGAIGAACCNTHDSVTREGDSLLTPPAALQTLKDAEVEMGGVSSGRVVGRVGGVVRVADWEGGLVGGDCPLGAFHLSFVHWYLMLFSASVRPSN